VAVSALVVNRIAPSFGDDEGNGDGGMREVAAAPAMMAKGADAAGGKAAEAGRALTALETNLAQLNAVAAREHASFAGLAARVAPAPVGCIPLFADDVHELDGLARAADHLFG